MARDRHTDWRSWLQKHRHLETNRVVRTDTTGHPIRLDGPQSAVADLVPRLPPPAYRPVPVRDNTSWTFPLAGRMPGLGTGRRVVRCANAELTGPSAVLVTNRGDGHAPRLIALDLPRWPRETFSQDGKTPLGWEE